MRAFVTTLLLLTTSCNGATATNTAATDSGPACVPHDGVYSCLGGTWPVCPSEVQEEVPCEAGTPTCMRCTPVTPAWGVGYTCDCQYALNRDGAVWICVGTESTCQ
jgi:hypothetical protein